LKVEVCWRLQDYGGHECDGNVIGKGMVWEEAIDGKETIDGCGGEDGDTAGGGGVNM
jgi:hypothetical protein